jgi:hypothetical protein
MTAETKIAPQGIKYVDVAWCAMDFTLLLSQETFDVKPGEIKAGGKLCVGVLAISPVMAKALAKDLAAAVEAFERQYGPIPAPPENANVVALRPVESGSSVEATVERLNAHLKELREAAAAQSLKTGECFLVRDAKNPDRGRFCRDCGTEEGDLHAPTCDWDGAVVC